jgi:hypothetical protein
MQVQVAEGQVVAEAGKASSISPPAGGGGKVGDWSEGGCFVCFIDQHLYYYGAALCHSLVLYTITRQIMGGLLNYSLSIINYQLHERNNNSSRYK